MAIASGSSRMSLSPASLMATSMVSLQALQHCVPRLVFHLTSANSGASLASTAGLLLPPLVTGPLVQIQLSPSPPPGILVGPTPLCELLQTAARDGN